MAADPTPQVGSIATLVGLLSVVRLRYKTRMDPSSKATPSASLAGLAAAAAFAAAALVAPGAASAQSGNPLFVPPQPPGEKVRGSADPGIARLKPGTPGVFVTSTGSARGPVRTTTDGRTWTDAGPHFIKTPSWLRDGRAGSPQIYWLPAIGKYVMLFSGQGPKGKGCIGRAVSDRPFNFTSHGRMIPAEGSGKSRAGYALECRDDGGYSLIDPSLFERNGKYFLLYKRNFGAGRGKLTPAERKFRNRPQDIVIRPINPDARAGLGPSTKLIAARPGTWEGKSVEAPTMIYRKGRYYLFYSGANYARESYAVGVAASLKGRDNRPTGRFKRFEGNPILRGSGNRLFCGVGHQDVVKSGDSWQIFYHAYLGEPEPGVRQNGNDCLLKRDGKTYRRFLMADVLRWDRRGGSPVRGDFWPSVNNRTPSGDGRPSGQFVE
ncbi:MAG: family 43 glycosylhydrolase [Solirubrobacteraceae bacterium MAG38_C4-C5]|nr:family 43 glycosylhydrolase [Candidatus Siliceabacter maunaloa]